MGQEGRREIPAEGEAGARVPTAPQELVLHGPRPAANHGVQLWPPWYISGF